MFSFSNQRFLFPKITNRKPNRRTVDMSHRSRIPLRTIRLLVYLLQLGAEEAELSHTNQIPSSGYQANGKWPQ